jgi:hypothetical protein
MQPEAKICKFFFNLFESLITIDFERFNVYSSRRISHLPAKFLQLRSAAIHLREGDEAVSHPNQSQS